MQHSEQPEPPTEAGVVPETNEPSSKRQKISHDATVDQRDRKHGMAPIKPEYLISLEPQDVVDDDAAEGTVAAGDDATGKSDPRDSGGKKGKKKQKGQNHNRSFGSFEDSLRLCNSRMLSNEFSPKTCKFGERCNMCHDLRLYLAEGRRPDVETLNGKCPVFESYGRCPSGWKCRKAINQNSMIIRTRDLVSLMSHQPTLNGILHEKKVVLEKSEAYIKWLDRDSEITHKIYNRKQGTEDAPVDPNNLEELRAQFVDPPFKPSEKRKIYFGRETPVLAPLTTQGNLPFRRLCTDLGAQITYSEMAMGLPLIQGQKGEWALMKTHESELASPRYTPENGKVVEGYDNSKDLKWGAQISGNQAWVAMKAAEALTKFLPHLRVIDLNCGCPIDLVYQTGAGSGLLDTPNKLEKMVRGMNAVSGEVPITVKLRTGVRDGRPTAQRIIERLAFGNADFRERLGAPGTAAITLHGRSRQQRYTKKANWEYIAECAALIQSYKNKKHDLTDTAMEPDASTQANTSDDRMYFIGNGDCYSHVDYFDHIDNAKVDSVMIARGAMIKPWIFEEIEKGQYLDKSASERLTYVEKFVRYGLEAWGSDEIGLGHTRRFLLEWLSFTCRYIPIGLLEHLPPNLQDRPPKYRCRDDLETLLASTNYKDWIKITEMFLGPAHPNFTFQPKHKSNSYEIDAEG
ncbi:hypothetical protein GQX73_g7080 [Xylaria multiplex]|uniref:tRNA-dihydrouridine(47) synthase [NAD(P)(+)] n=1 Tax=Xylaria multiplex TaxID=323545 RepID=A0A7C8ILH0_9PEZI|nr:hypothetical protein GQX73_g7080 [Xylaria multiplex]